MNPAPGGGSSEAVAINLPVPIDPNDEGPGGDSSGTLFPAARLAVALGHQ